MVTNVISQHATVLALFSALSWIECVKCNDNLLYSSKTRHSTQETPSLKQKYIFKPFVRRIILFSLILVKVERLYWTAFGRFIATRPLHDRHIVDWISQLCSCWTARQIQGVNFSPRSERRSFCLETYESSNGKIAVLILDSRICLEERSLKETSRVAALYISGVGVVYWLAASRKTSISKNNFVVIHHDWADWKTFQRR